MTETANTGTAPERIDLPGGWTLVLSDSFRTWCIVDPRGHDHGHCYIDTSEALAALSSPAPGIGEIARLEAELTRLRAELAESRAPEELRRLLREAAEYFQVSGFCRDLRGRIEAELARIAAQAKQPEGETDA